MAENIVKRLNFAPTGGASSATGIAYDNDNSGLSATNVQDAIDELASDLDAESTGRQAADADLAQDIADETARALAAEALLIPASEKGQPLGVATLDGTGKVPAGQLPSYVDDVLEFANLASFPVTGESGKIYIALDTGFQYRWSGSAYIQLSVSPVSSVFGRTGAVMAQNGDYTASQVTNVPSGNLAATNVQGALNELQSDIDTRALDSALSQEISDRQAADSALQADIDQEIMDRQSADTLLQNDIDEVASDLADEITRAQAAEALVQTNLTNHINDALDAHDASAISYDNTTSGLLAEEVQAAIDEVNDKINNFNPGSPGDIPETNFNLSNNQSSPANVSGLVFSTSGVRSFQALLSVEIDATADLYEEVELNGIFKGTSWDMSIESVGDDSLVNFTITNDGEVQYTSSNYSGFSSGKIKFRAITTSL